MVTARTVNDMEVEGTTTTRPDPDPTVLTTRAMLREVDGLREKFTHDMGMLRELIEARLNGNDAAVALLRTSTDKLPNYITSTVSGLQELHEEKFNSIQTQFKERDTRTEQASKDSKVAIDAALSAQKESVDKQNISNTLAVNKSEASFTKQVDEIGKRIETVAKSLDEKVADIKERLTTIESRGVGALTQKVEQRQEAAHQWGYVVGGAGFLLALIPVIFLVAKAIM